MAASMLVEYLDNEGKIITDVPGRYLQGELVIRQTTNGLLVSNTNRLSLRREKF